MKSRLIALNVVIVVLLTAVLAGCSAPKFRSGHEAYSPFPLPPYHQFGDIIIEPFMSSHAAGTDSISLVGHLTVHVPRDRRPDSESGRYTSIGRTLLFVETADHPLMLSARYLSHPEDSQLVTGDYIARESYHFSVTRIPAPVKRIIVVYEVFRVVKKGRDIPRIYIADTLFPYPVGGEDGSALWSGPERRSPFSPSNVLTYLIDGADSADVHIVLYNALGQDVGTLIDERQSRGAHTVTIEPPPGSPSGVYFARITINGTSKVKKIVFLR